MMGSNIKEAPGLHGILFGFWELLLRWWMEALLVLEGGFGQ